MEKTTLEQDKTNPLQRPVIQTLDLSEQGEYPYVVFPPASLADKGLGAVGVDGWDITRGMFQGYRRKDAIQIRSKDGKTVQDLPPIAVIILPESSDWAVYSTTLLRTITREAAMREVAADIEAHRGLAKELYGAEEGSITQILRERMEKGLEKDPETGQYL